MPRLSTDATDLPKLRRISGSDRRIMLVSAGTVASRLFSKLSQLAFLVIAARMLSVDEFASYSYLIILAVTFSLLADTGVALAATREISAGRRAPAEAFWSSLPVIGAGAVLGASLILGFGLVDSGPGSSGVPLLLTCAFVAVNTVFNFAASTLRGVGRLVYEAVLQGLGALFFLAAAGGALALGGGLTVVLAVFVGKELLSTVVALGGLRQYTGSPRRWSPGLWRRLLRIGIKLAVASTALALVTRIPGIVLGNTGSSPDLAWYSGAQRLADAVLLLGTTSGFSLLPSLSLLLESESERAWQLLWRVLAGGVVLGAAIGVVAVILAPEIVTVAYGSDFEDAAAPARVLMAATPAYAIVGIAWYALVALGRERRLVVLAAGAAALSLVLSLALIPGGDDVSASVAYVAALVTLAVVMVAGLGLIQRSSQDRNS